jgi:hypothetical protein
VQLEGGASNGLADWLASEAEPFGKMAGAFINLFQQQQQPDASTDQSSAQLSVRTTMHSNAAAAHGLHGLHLCRLCWHTIFTIPTSAD